MGRTINRPSIGSLLGRLHRADVQLAGGAQDTNRNLAAVCNEQLAEQAPVAKFGWSDHVGALSPASLVAAPRQGAR